MWFDEFKGDELQREPTLDELFLHTHVKRTNHGWMNDQRRFMRSTKKKIMEVSSSQDAPPQLLPPQTQLSIWKETVGLTHKGTIYGFGMEGLCVPTSAPSTSNMTITLKTTIAQLEKERKSKRKVKKRLNRVEKQLSETTSFLKNLMQHMNYPSPVNANVGSGVGISVSSASENDQQYDKEEEDEEEGDHNDVKDVGCFVL